MHVEGYKRETVVGHLIQEVGGDKTVRVHGSHAEFVDGGIDETSGGDNRRTAGARIVDIAPEIHHN